MEFNGIVKFDDKITIEGKVVMAIYGEFNKTTGHCNIYYNTTDIEAIKNNREEVQKQLESSKIDLQKKMGNEGFLYTI